MTIMKDDLYEGVRGFLLSVKWPKGLIVDTRASEEAVWIVLYRDNFNTFDGVDKLAISKIVGETINAIRKQGCPCYLAVEPGDGR